MKKYIDVDFNCGMTIEEAVKYLRQLSYETGKDYCGTFNCNMCNKLETLKGAPEVVRGDFYCSFCNKLKITDSDRKKYKLIY